MRMPGAFKPMRIVKIVRSTGIIKWRENNRLEGTNQRSILDYRLEGVHPPYFTLAGARPTEDRRSRTESWRLSRLESELGERR